MQNRNDHINNKTMENKVQGGNWEINSLSWELYWWVGFFNIAFFKATPVPEPVFSFEANREKSLGHYPVNGKGSTGDTYIYKVNPHQPLWQLLIAVLHLMTHAWQDLHGLSSKGWFHNKEFRVKMAKFGIECNQKGGCTALGNPFVFLLKKHGVIIGPRWHLEKFFKNQKTHRPNGKSKLKKWSCGCQNVRVGKKSFEATCDRCSNKFKLKD